MIPYEPCDERAERSRLDGQWKEVVVVELLLSGVGSNKREKRVFPGVGMEGRMKKGLLAGIVALFAMLALASPGAASNATIIGTDTIRVTATANETNRILVTYASGSDIYTVSDSAANITASGLCAAVDTHTVECPGPGITTIDVDVGRANDSAELDRVTIPTAVTGKLVGDSGNDTLLGANGPGDIRGGSGRDLIDGRNGADDIQGGSNTDMLLYPADRATTLFVTVGSGNNNDGNELDQTGSRRDTVHADVEGVTGALGGDILIGDRSAETLIGGDGNDFLAGQGGGDALFGLLGDDLLSGGDGNDTARGFFGNDRVLGGPGNDRLIGGADNDFVRGKKGIDVMKGNTGIDAINAKDGTRDTKINCGPGPRSQEWAKRDKRLDPRPRSC
jgi:Ca2+-binding RTX toxin-like protein